MQLMFKCASIRIQKQTYLTTHSCKLHIITQAELCKEDLIMVRTRRNQQLNYINIIIVLVQNNYC